MSGPRNGKKHNVLILELVFSSRKLIQFGPEFDDPLITLVFPDSCKIDGLVEKLFGKPRCSVKQTSFRKASVACSPVECFTSESTSQPDASQSSESEIPKSQALHKNTTNFSLAETAANKLKRMEYEVYQASTSTAKNYQHNKSASSANQTYKMSIPCEIMDVHNKAIIQNNSSTEGIPSNSKENKNDKKNEIAIPKTPTNKSSSKRVKTLLIMAPSSTMSKKSETRRQICSNVIQTESDVEIVSSSVPEEVTCVPDSQTFCKISGTKQQKNPVNPVCNKEQRKQEMLDLKSRLEKTDHKFQEYDKRCMKLVSSPCLSHVSEESSKTASSCPKTPKPQMKSIAEKDEFQSLEERTKKGKGKIVIDHSVPKSYVNHNCVDEDKHSTMSRKGRKRQKIESSTSLTVKERKQPTRSSQRIKSSNNSQENSSKEIANRDRLPSQNKIASKKNKGIENLNNKINCNKSKSQMGFKASIVPEDPPNSNIQSNMNSEDNFVKKSSVDKSNKILENNQKHNRDKNNKNLQTDLNNFSETDSFSPGNTKKNDVGAELIVQVGSQDFGKELHFSFYKKQNKYSDNDKVGTVISQNTTYGKDIHFGFDANGDNSSKYSENKCTEKLNYNAEPLQMCDNVNKPYVTKEPRFFKARLLENISNNHTPATSSNVYKFTSPSETGVLASENKENIVEDKQNKLSGKKKKIFGVADHTSKKPKKGKEDRIQNKCHKKQVLDKIKQKIQNAGKTSSKRDICNLDPIEIQQFNSEEQTPSDMEKETEVLSDVDLNVAAFTKVCQELVASSKKETQRSKRIKKSVDYRAERSEISDASWIKSFKAKKKKPKLRTYSAAHKKFKTTEGGQELDSSEDEQTQLPTKSFSRYCLVSLLQLPKYSDLESIANSSETSDTKQKNLDDLTPSSYADTDYGELYVEEGSKSFTSKQIKLQADKRNVSIGSSYLTKVTKTPKSKWRYSSLNVQVTPQTDFMMTEHFSIETVRKDEPEENVEDDGFYTPVMLQRSPLNPASDCEIDLMSQASSHESCYTHISSIETPHIPLFTQDDEDDVIILSDQEDDLKFEEIEQPVLYPVSSAKKQHDAKYLKSGPSSTRRPNSKKRAYEEVRSEIDSNNSDNDVRNDFDTDGESSNYNFGLNDVSNLISTNNMFNFTSNPNRDDAEFSDGTDSPMSTFEAEDLPFYTGVMALVTSYGKKMEQQILERRRIEELSTREVLQNISEQPSKIWLSEKEKRHKLAEEHKNEMLHELTSLGKDVMELNNVKQKSEDFFKRNRKVLKSVSKAQGYGVEVTAQKQEKYLKCLQTVINSDTPVENGLHKETEKTHQTFCNKIMVQMQQRQLRRVKMSVQALMYS